MSLLTRAIELTTRLERNRRQAEYLHSIRDFRRRRETFSAAYAEVGRLEAPLRVLKSAGISGDVLPPGAPDFALFLDSLITDFDADPGCVLDQNRFEVNKFQNGIRRICDDIRLMLQEAWRSYIDGIRPQFDQGLLDTLNSMPDYRPTVEKIKERMGRLDQLSIRLPNSADDISEAKDRAEEANRVWNEELRGGAIPPSVLEFLRAAGSTAGADLNLLTPEILTYLRQEGLESSFRIRAASAAGGRP